MTDKRRLLGVTLGLATLAMSTGASMTFYEESLPSTMNPLFASSMVDNRVHELVFDRLYFHDPVTNELTSRLVDSYELADGGKAVKLNLAKGIKWHDGQPMKIGRAHV